MKETKGDLSYEELRDICDNLELAAQRALSVKQELIQTRDQFDRELGRYKHIQAYNERVLRREDDEDFGTITAEAIVEAFEVEVGLVTRWRSDAPTLEVVACFGMDDPPTVLAFDREWLGGREARLLDEAHPLLSAWSSLCIHEAIICPFFDQRRELTGLLIGGVTEASKGFYVHLTTEMLSSFAVMAEQAGLLLRNQESYEIIERQVQELREATRAKNEFLATVSHELRTPLNSIINIPDGLLKQFDDFAGAVCRQCDAVFECEAGDRVDDATVCPDCGAPGSLERSNQVVFSGNPQQTVFYLQQVRRCGRYLLSVIGDILDMSKLEVGEMRLNRAWTTVDDLFAGVRANCESVAAEKQMALHFAPVGENEHIFVDEIRMAQVIINLVTNAIHHSRSTKPIEVGFGRVGDMVEFSVRDNGMGIAEEHHQLIFESFRHVPKQEGVANRSGGGTGLGLAIAKEIVRLHGGKIEVKSAVGQGAKFTITIPVNAEVAVGGSS